MSDWSLRLAKPPDALAMPDIEQAAGGLFEQSDWETGTAGTHAMPVASCERLIRKGHCLVATKKDKLVGFVLTEPFKRELHIVEMDVHPRDARQGIGTGLVRACQIDARNCGFRALTLTTFRDVPWNQPLYSKLGFVEVADLDAHPRLSAELDKEAQHGLPRERRCAMILFLD